MNTKTNQVKFEKALHSALAALDALKEAARDVDAELAECDINAELERARDALVTVIEDAQASIEHEASLFEEQAEVVKGEDEMQDTGNRTHTAWVQHAFERTYTVFLTDEAGRVFVADGPTAREAYRAAYRKLREQLAEDRSFQISHLEALTPSIPF